MDESEITNEYLERERDRRGVFEAFVEEPYNHYGQRGQVDLHLDQYDLHTVVEFKSEYAAKKSIGANEIIRQFNKARKSFFAGTNHTPDEQDNIVFKLIFENTDYNIKNISDNGEMYVRVVEDSTPIEGIPQSAPVITKILIMNQWEKERMGSCLMIANQTIVQKSILDLVGCMRIKVIKNNSIVLTELFHYWQ